MTTGQVFYKAFKRQGMYSGMCNTLGRVCLEEGISIKQAPNLYFILGGYCPKEGTFWCFITGSNYPHSPFYWKLDSKRGLIWRKLLFLYLSIKYINTPL